MSVGSSEGIVEAIRFDLTKFHETWMELLYPRQRETTNTVLGKWEPTTTREEVTYRAWAALGVLVIGVVYPLALLGVVVRFHTRRIDVSISRAGPLAVVLLAVVVWGGLAALAEFQFAFGAKEANAIAGASLVAIAATAVAVGVRKVGGRKSVVLVGYPLAMTAIFLPPVVAALVSDRVVAGFVIVESDRIARFILNEVLRDGSTYFSLLGDVRAYFVTNFERQGFAYVWMWLGASIPAGWLLGMTVELAEFIRPTGE
jgi:hypothetical protein